MQSSRGKERKDEKAFINEQSKEVEENNGKGKTRDLFKNIGDTEGMFHVRMGIIKEETVRTQQKQKRLRRGGKNTQKSCTKKVSMIQKTTMVWSLTWSLTSLQSEVKWALGSITTNKASGGGEIPAERFRILKEC